MTFWGHLATEPATRRHLNRAIPNTDMSTPISHAENTKRQVNSQKRSKNSFVGKCSDINDHVYDVGLGHNGFELFVKTTQEIAEDMSSNLKDASEFRIAMDPNTLTFASLKTPQSLVANAGIM